MIEQYKIITYIILAIIFFMGFKYPFQIEDDDYRLGGLFLYGVISIFALALVFHHIGKL